MSASRVCSSLTLLARSNSRVALTSYLQLRQLASEAQCTPGQWQLVSAVCLQRMPVITAKKTKLEQRFLDMMTKIELEKSLLSDHELKSIDDKAIADKRKQEGSEDTDVEKITQTALDLEDAWEAEAKQFTPAPRTTETSVDRTSLEVLTTEYDGSVAENELFQSLKFQCKIVNEADVKNDLHSTERELDRTLFLLVKQKIGDKTQWIFPQGPHLKGESMRQAAERVLHSHCGKDVKATFLGNAPCGFYQYNFPPEDGTGNGAKVFFFKAWHEEGSVELDMKITSDFMWVTRDELPKFCSKAYLKSIKKFLVDL